MLAPQVAALLQQFPGVRHLQIEDGEGRPLGRSFRVKLWPTFVFLRDGRLVQQLARPAPKDIQQGLQAITGSG